MTKRDEYTRASQQRERESMHMTTTWDAYVTWAIKLERHPKARYMSGARLTWSVHLLGASISRNCRLGGQSPALNQPEIRRPPSYPATRQPPRGPSTLRPQGDDGAVGPVQNR